MSCVTHHYKVVWGERHILDYIHSKLEFRTDAASSRVYGLSFVQDFGKARRRCDLHTRAM